MFEGSHEDFTERCQKAMVGSVRPLRGDDDPPLVLFLQPEDAESLRGTALEPAIDAGPLAVPLFVSNLPLPMLLGPFGAAILQTKPVRIAVGSAAWFIDARTWTDEEVDQVVELGVHNHPQREEVLELLVVDVDIPAEQYTARVVRGAGPDGEILVGDWQLTAGIAHDPGTYMPLAAVLQRALDLAHE